MFGQYSSQYHGRTTIEQSFSENPGQSMVGKPKRIANNTFHWEREDGATVIRLHFTDIIVKHKDGSVQLTSGGFKTMITKDRLNRFLDRYSVYSDRGVWKVRENGTSRETVFRDGMILPRDMRPNDKLEKKLRDLGNRINRFVKKLDELEKLPMPSAGDCWFCLMVTNEKETLGDTTNNHSHLISHIEEGYMHGSLIVAAMRFCGYTDQKIRYVLHSNKRRSRHLVKNALQRYLRAKLGL